MSKLYEILNSPGLYTNNASEEAILPETGSTSFLDQLLRPRKSDLELIIDATADIKKNWKDLKNNAEHGFILNAYNENFSEYVKLSIELIELHLERLWSIAEFKEGDPEEMHALYLVTISRLLKHMTLLQAVITCSAYSHNGLSQENLSAMRSQAETAMAELKKSKESARKGGINSGKTRGAEADETWKLDTLRLAQTIRAEDPRITQENLADEIRRRWTLKVKLPGRKYIIKHISQWEQEEKLERSLLKGSKNGRAYTH